MTLTEYINQENAEVMPHVTLAKDEFRIVEEFVSKGEKCIEIVISLIADKFGISGLYIKRGESNKLFCAENNHLSCFNYPSNSTP